MYGIISCSSANKYIVNSDGSVSSRQCTEEELAAYNADMSAKGFIPNPVYDCYLLNGYGAYMGRSKVSDINNTFYWKYFIDIGYELVLGPAPYTDEVGSYGVFCKNYEDIYKQGIIKRKEKIEGEEKSNISLPNLFKRIGSYRRSNK